MDSIKSAQDSGAINQSDYGTLVKDHLQQQIDGGQTKRLEIERERSTNPAPLTRAAVDAAAQGREVKAQTTDREGNTESVDIRGDGGDWFSPKPPASCRCGRPARTTVGRSQRRS